MGVLDSDGMSTRPLRWEILHLSPNALINVLSSVSDNLAPTALQKNAPMQEKKELERSTLWKARMEIFFIS